MRPPLPARRRRHEVARARRMADSSDALIARFLALHPKMIDLSLGRIERLLADARQSRAPPAAGDPCRRHERQGLDDRLHARDPRSAGLAVHVYTSPHLVRFHERIRARRLGGGRFVEEDRLVEALRRCEAVNAGEPITVFEITTAAAFLLFAEDAGRRAAARGRARRRARRHQRHRPGRPPPS